MYISFHLRDYLINFFWLNANLTPETRRTKVGVRKKGQKNWIHLHEFQFGISSTIDIVFLLAFFEARQTSTIESRG